MYEKRGEPSRDRVSWMISSAPWPEQPVGWSRAGKANVLVNQVQDLHPKPFAQPR